MLKDYKVFFVKYSDDTCKHVAAVNMEHALYTANLWIDLHYNAADDVDVVSIHLIPEIRSLLIFKPEE